MEYSKKKLFPSLMLSSPLNLFEIYFVSEGYSASSEFFKDCKKIITKISNQLKIAFNDFHPSILEISGIYISSNKSEISINNPPQTGSTAFESWVQSPEGIINFNIDKLKSILKEVKLDETENTENSLFERTQSSQALVVILLPSIGENGGEIEIEEKENDLTYLVSTSLDGFYEQIVLRALCKKLGLGDEFELEGDDYLQPNGFEEIIIDEVYPNLIYVKFAGEGVRWGSRYIKSLSPASEKNKPTSVVSNDVHPDNADNFIPLYNYSPDSLNNRVWEGGGGYRTKVFRSAQDCLMRRQIGNKVLPVRKTKVPLCPICETYLRSKLLEAVKYDSSNSFEFRQGLIQPKT